MTDPSRFACVLIRPRKDLGSVSRAFAMARLPFEDDFRARLFELPLIAVIVDAELHPVWSPTLFLAEVALGSRSVTGDTVRTYGEAILPWLRYLEDQRISLEEVTEELIGVYRANLTHQNCDQCGGKYASATINQRVVVPALFHAWGQRRGLMPSPLGHYLNAGDSAAIWRTGMGRGRHRSLKVARIATPRIIKRLPVALSSEEIARVFLTIRFPYRLMLRWALVTGLRRFEVCNLRLVDLPAPQQIANSTDGLLQLTLLRKGSRELTVQVPSRLVEETHWYVLTERIAPAPFNEQFVFLNSRGRKFSRQSLTKAFRKSANAIGSNATLHHLRHTFAVETLKVLERHAIAGDEINPLKTLQTLLGHASIDTTDIYLQAADASSPGVMEALNYLYGGAI